MEVKHGPCSDCQSRTYNWFHGPWLFNFLLSFPEKIYHWVRKAVNGNVRFNVPRGTLTVGVSGFYYIYSQLYYVDGSALFLGHSTYVNDRKVLASTSSVVSRNRRLQYELSWRRVPSTERRPSVGQGSSWSIQDIPHESRVQLLWAVSRT